MATLPPCSQATTKTQELLGGSTSKGTETHFCGVSPKQNQGGACAWNDTCASSYKVLPAEGDTLDEGDGKHDISGGCTQGSWGHRPRPSVHQNNASFRWTRSAPLARAGPSQAATVCHAAKALTELPSQSAQAERGSISTSRARYSLPQGTNCGSHRMPRPWPCLTPINWSLKHWTRHLLLPHSGSEARALGNRRNGNLRARRTAPKHSGIRQETELYVLLPKCLWMRQRGKDQSRNFPSLQLRCSPPESLPTRGSTEVPQACTPTSTHSLPGAEGRGRNGSDRQGQTG